MCDTFGGTVFLFSSRTIWVYSPLNRSLYNVSRRSSSFSVPGSRYPPPTPFMFRASSDFVFYHLFFRCRYSDSARPFPEVLSLSGPFLPLLSKRSTLCSAFFHSWIGFPSTCCLRCIAHLIYLLPSPLRNFFWSKTYPLRFGSGPLPVYSPPRHFRATPPKPDSDVTPFTSPFFLYGWLVFPLMGDYPLRHTFGVRDAH